MIALFFMARKRHVPRAGMFGTAHWHGQYKGKPALVLSFWGGAHLWVFDGGWYIAKKSECLRDIDNYLGIKWGEPYKDIL